MTANKRETEGGKQGRIKEKKADDEYSSGHGNKCC
jgi:hypothetical protein